MEMHNLADVIQIFIAFFFIALVLNIKHCSSSSSFERKGDKLYNSECKFTMENTEISSLSIYFYSNKLVFPLSKTTFFK